MTTLSSFVGRREIWVDGFFWRLGWPLRLMAAMAAPAAHAATDFYSSFESGDPAPTWESTAEVDSHGDKKMSGVTGSSSPGIPGNIRDKVVAVTASAENPPGETAERVNDGDVNSKWLAFEPTGWVRYQLSEPVTVVDYALSSANDSAERDPADWELQGSHDGSAWTTVDTQTGQDFSERFQTKQYDVASPGSYEYYRLNITANHGGGLIQLAELQLSDGDTTPPPATDMKAFATSGPVNGPTMKPNAGWTGVKALRYSGGHTADGRGYAYDKVFDVDIKVTRHSELSYLIFPELTNNDLGYPSTYAAVDLAFTDGTYLSDLRARDQQEYDLDPQGQGASKSLYANQWNRKVSDIGAVAAGKTIDRILVGYDNPKGTHLFNGWFDDIRIDGSPAKETHARPSDWVLTTRGTNSTGGFSRGNNIPATAVPHGFNFWTPMTDAGSISWLYAYQQDNNDDNLPRIEAFAASHEPSPWMGDRQTFQVMPSPATGVPNAGRDDRALTFKHANEIAKPYRYGVKFENGMRTDIAPTDHAGAVPLRVHRRRGQRDPRQRRPGRGRLRPHHQPGRRHDQRLVRRRQRALQRRRAPVRLRHVRQAGDPEREAERGRPRLDRLRQVRHEHRQGREPADRHLADEHRAGEEEPGARDPADRHADVARGARADPVGRQARRRRGRGRDPGPEPDALLEPLPAVAVSELGARERRHRAPPRSGSTRCSPRPTRRRRRRPRPAATSSTARSTSTTASGTPTGPSGRATRCSTPRRRASWSTGSSSSTATAAGSRAGPRRATRT